MDLVSGILFFYLKKSNKELTLVTENIALTKLINITVKEKLS